MAAAAVLLAREGGLSFVNLRVIPGEEEAVLVSLRQIWKGYGLMRPFEGVTFTQHIEYEGTVRGLQDTRAIMRVIALLAVMIACLGLLGIAAYAAEARIKEVGIRKSIGATAQSLVVLSSREQAMLVAISVVIALPGAAFFNDWWMGMYPNRAELTAGVVAGPAILLLALALATVATQSARAALTNPLEESEVRVAGEPTTGRVLRRVRLPDPMLSCLEQPLIRALHLPDLDLPEHGGVAIGVASQLVGDPVVEEAGDDGLTIVDEDLHQVLVDEDAQVDVLVLGQIGHGEGRLRLSHTQ